MNQGMIDYNRAALERLFAWMCVRIGLFDRSIEALNASDRTARAMRRLAQPSTIIRHTHRLIAPLLKAVESATRRLIIWMAISMPKHVLRPSDLKARVVAETGMAGEAGNEIGLAVERTAPVRIPRFALTDPVSFRIIWRDADEPVVSFDPSHFIADPDSAFEPVTDRHLMRRIAALAHVFDDIAAQAKRFRRWVALRDAGRTARKHPFKPGAAPGAPPYRLPQSRYREEHLILRELQREARYAYNHRNDTS